MGRTTGVLKVMKGPCEHCGNPDKALWQSECTYRGGYPSRRAFELSTFDAPCACDAYDEGQRELWQKKRNSFFRLAGTAIFLAVLAIVMIFVLLSVHR